MNPMDTDRLCLMSGCQLGNANRQLEAAQQAVQKAAVLYQNAVTEREIALSGALWCDMGEHSFSARDRKRTTYKVETINEDTGQAEEDSLTACGPCAEQRKAMFQPKPVQLAIPAGADSEEYTRYLEWRAGMTQPAAEPG